MESVDKVSCFCFPPSSQQCLTMCSDGFNFNMNIFTYEVKMNFFTYIFQYYFYFSLGELLGEISDTKYNGI